MGENIYYTYAWLRENRTPYYIGKGKAKRAWRKGSPKRERVLILKKNLTEKEAFKHEEYMISVFGRKDLGTGILRNLTNGGEGPTGVRISDKNRVITSERMSGCTPHNKGKPTSEETKRKISVALTERRLSEEHRRKVSEKTRGENNPNYGKTISGEQKRKLSESLTGRSLSEEHLNRLRGRPLSEEQRKKMSERMLGENNPNYGKTISEEQKRKMSESLRKAMLGENNPNYGKTISEEQKRKISESLKKRRKASK